MKIALIGLTGLAGSGKTTVASLLATNGKRPAVTLKLAQPLYDMQQYIYQRAGLEQPATKDRKLLQYLGTEWGRGIDQEIWLKVWTRDYLELRERRPDALIVVDDVRFDNEAQLIRSFGGRVVQVMADAGARARRLNQDVPSHASENGVSPDLIDWRVNNNFSWQDLEGAVANLWLLGSAELDTERGELPDSPELRRPKKKKIGEKK